MLRRFVIGFVKGALVGALMTVVWSRVFGGDAFVGAASYLVAILTGAVTGLVAGRPLWAKGALVEAAVKGFVGALVGGAGLYAMDKWIRVSVDLGPLGAGLIGDVAAFALLGIALAIGAVFELDNTGMEVADDSRARVAPERARVASGGAGELEELEAAEPRARQKH